MTGALHQHYQTQQGKQNSSILDGHKSLTHNIAALRRASECGIIMLSLPPHTSHKMQPLDITFLYH